MLIDLVTSVNTMLLDGECVLTYIGERTLTYCDEVA